MNFTLDWFFLSLQIVALGTIILREMFRRQRRNLYAILIPATLLILVQGQAWWMLDKFEANALTEFQHLYQTISIQGVRLANLYVSLCILCLAITYGYLSSVRKRVLPDSVNALQRPAKLSVHHLLVATLVLSFALMIIHISGGVISAITNPGLTFVHGLVFFLMLLWLGKLPVLNNLAVARRNNWLDMFLFLSVIVVFLFNSRFLVSFIFIQLILLYNYCRREIRRKTYVEAGIILFSIFFFFGIYRHYIPQYEMIQQELSAGFIIELFSVKNLIEWFYGLNVEGFAGFAGLLTYEAYQGGIDYDFGLSSFSALFQFLPSSLRFSENFLFKDLREFFFSVYPYSGSVIPSGMENAYANFGLAGVLGLGILLGYLMHWLHQQMLNPRADRLLIALLSVHSLQLIRGSFYLVIFFVLSEIIILTAYRVILRLPRFVALSSRQHG